MADDNRPIKYARYAIGEIVLVVIGILIALQINNWNEARIQKKELDGLLHSIANGVQSDIRNLNLLVTARLNIGKKADSIFENYVFNDVNSLSPQEMSFINIAFANMQNTLYFKPNLSAFESLKSSTYFGTLQNTDLALLLSAYYANADKIKTNEEDYNQGLKTISKEWIEKFRDRGDDLFLSPWKYFDDIAAITPTFLEILRDDLTKNILSGSYYEMDLVKVYEEQLLMGNALVKMVKKSETTFDEKTKLDFSGILYSFADADIVSILINGKIPSGFDIRYAASGLLPNNFLFENDYLLIEYPANTYDWGACYFWVDALDGRVNEMDFSRYSKIIVEMKGEKGGEDFELAMKDKTDPPDGSETRLKMELTDQWKTYEIDVNQFASADLKTINVPLSFVFTGGNGRKIYIRSIQFKNN